MVVQHQHQRHLHVTTAIVMIEATSVVMMIVIEMEGSGQGKAVVQSLIDRQDLVCKMRGRGVETVELAHVLAQLQDHQEQPLQVAAAAATLAAPTVDLLLLLHRRHLA